MEALRLVNQRLLRQNEELMGLLKRPQEARPAREGQNNLPRGERQHLDPIREANEEGENIHIMGQVPPQPPQYVNNEEALSQDEGVDRNDVPPFQQERMERYWEQRFQDLQHELSHMKEAVRGKTPVTMEALVQQTESPFTTGILHFPLPPKFRMPQIEPYDGKKDPVGHLNTYKNQMELHGYQDPVRCRAFAITLKDSALAWFNRLPPASISSFKELSVAFVSHFIGAMIYRKPSYHLLNVKQGSDENLRSYVKRFNSESLKVDVPDEKFAITAFIAGLGVQSKDLMFSISKNPQASMAEVLAKAEKYINGEEALLSKIGSSYA